MDLGRLLRGDMLPGVGHRTLGCCNCDMGFQVPQLSLHSPVGSLTLSEEDGAIVALDWGWGRDQEETELLALARLQMHEYLDGERRRFDVPIWLNGTIYQQKVWNALLDIPYGQTRTYTDIVRVAGGNARSVGQASRCNPIPILVPCHRVIGAADMENYLFAQGLDTKRHLLKIEGSFV